MNNQKGQKPPVRVIATHTNAHLDDLAAIAVALEFGERRWRFDDGGPEIRFVDETEAAELATRYDAVLIGIGGGRLDEHKKEGRMRNTCAFDLVLKFLGIDHWLQLKEISREIRRADNQAGQRAFELAQLIKESYTYGGASEMRMLRVVQLFLKSKFRRQRAFWACKRDFDSSCTLEDAGGLISAVVQSDNQEMNSFCRFQRAQVVAIRQSSGRILVFSDNKSERAWTAVFYIAKAIIETELTKLGAGDEAVLKALDEMEACGERGLSVDLPGLPNCHWHAEAGALYCGGTKTHQEKEPLHLSIEELLDVVRAGIDEMLEVEAELEETGK